MASPPPQGEMTTNFPLYLNLFYSFLQPVVNSFLHLKDLGRGGSLFFPPFSLGAPVNNKCILISSVFFLLQSKILSYLKIKNS